MTTVRRTDPAWLLAAQKQDLEEQAFRELARKFAIAVLIGLAVAAFFYATKWGW